MNSAAFALSVILLYAAIYFFKEMAYAITLKKYEHALFSLLLGLLACAFYHFQYTYTISIFYNHLN